MDNFVPKGLKLVFTYINNALRNLYKFGRKIDGRPEVLIFIQLQQDLDILLPIIHLLRDSFIIKLLVTTETSKASPRILRIINEVNITPAIIPFKEIAESENHDVLLNIDAVITASETNQNPHRAANNLVKIANLRKIQTITIQHGLENIGLTYFDERFGADVKFSSNHILTWSQLNQLPENIPLSTRSKCIHFGCPKYSVSNNYASVPLEADFIAVFENLHWHRYTELYREAFLNNLYSTIEKFPSERFIVKPHHAGKWLTSRYSGLVREYPNLTVLDPNDPRWEPYTATSIIKSSKGVITTPSTVALDAASLHTPVAIVGNGLDINEIYSPLNILHNENDWYNFITTLNTKHQGNKTNSWYRKNTATKHYQKKVLLELIKSGT